MSLHKVVFFWDQPFQVGWVGWGFFVFYWGKTVFGWFGWSTFSTGLKPGWNGWKSICLIMLRDRSSHQDFANWLCTFITWCSCRDAWKEPGNQPCQPWRDETVSWLVTPQGTLWCWKPQADLMNFRGEYAAVFQQIDLIVLLLAPIACLASVFVGAPT